MILDEISAAFDAAQSDTLELRFVFHSDSRYICYSPNLRGQIGADLYQQFKTEYSDINSRIRKIEEPKFINYDPTISPQKNEIEYIDTNRFGNIHETIHDQIMLNPQPLTRLGNNWGDIGFIVVSLVANQHNLLIFSTFSFGKNIGPTFRAEITGRNELKKVNNKTVGIEKRIDLVAYDGKMLVVNHNVVDKIFFLKDYFKNQKKYFFDSVSNIQAKFIEDKKLPGFVIDERDLEYFKRYADNSQERMKKIWSINSENNLEKFFSNIGNMPKVIEKFGLTVQFDPITKKLSLPHTPQAMNELLKCMGDKFYLSILFEEPGVDESKRR
ncbi:Kiwa anti-phage protein KwaB-like domain-containing protein [Lacticaseibacillus paracasei]|uniref:Kiwa anti-phage protein KwaB-like domain-containing protein n=1 Tax=Lacticaseibacillus paracasei TaxID=1597 RepID=UPI003DA88A59